MLCVCVCVGVAMFAGVYGGIVANLGNCVGTCVGLWNRDACGRWLVGRLRAYVGLVGKIAGGDGVGNGGRENL